MFLSIRLCSALAIQYPTRIAKAIVNAHQRSGVPSAKISWEHALAPQFLGVS